MRASACASPGKAEGGTGSPPPKKKNNRGGRGGGRENSPQPPNRPPTPQEAAKPPPRRAPKTGPPKRHRGDTKPRTAAQREKAHRNMQTHTTKKKKEPAAQPERRGMGKQGPQGPGQGHRAKKKPSAKNTLGQPSQEGLGTAETRAAARTPTPHAGTGNSGGQAGGARNHTRPISRPKPNPHHEHHKQPTLEGQHHKPCPNTPTQDPSQDWRG